MSLRPILYYLGCLVVMVCLFALWALAQAQSALVVRLAWDAPAGAPAGVSYHVYRRTDDQRAWVRLTRVPVPQGTEAAPWVDHAPHAGTNLYQVTAVLDGFEESPGSNRAGTVFCVTPMLNKD